MKIPRYSVLALIASLLALPVVAAVDVHDHLGMQVWSLRETAKTDLPGSLDLIKSYGLTEIEANGAPPIAIEEYAKLIKDRGLVSIGAHFGYEMLTKDLDTAVKNAKILGLKYAATAWIPHDAKIGLTAAQAHQAAIDFNRAGEAFRAAGIQFAWHCHGFEFVPLASEGGKTAFDIIVAETKPENLVLEMDVFWVFHAGQDPVTLLKKFPGRWQLMHVKDIRKGAILDASGGAAPIDNVAVGTGQINWPVVLKTAQDNGTKYFFIEDETPTPLVCIPDSLKYLRALKL